MTETVDLASLTEDLEIYPRGSVSEMHVTDLRYALDAGAVLPPPVIDRATMKIVDGFHRIRAQRRHLGDEASIEAEVRDFADDAEMLLESARLNSPHGLPLGRYDQRVFAIKARKLGAADDDIAGALGVTPARLLTISVMVAKSDNGDVALKGGTKHLGGSYLSPEQVAEIRRQRGAPARSKAAELTRMLRQNLAPVATDPDLRLALVDLSVAIQDVMDTVG
jgi:hypothetical protein